MTTYTDYQQRQLDQIEIVAEPRTPGIADAVDMCARGKMTFRDCCRYIDALGFKTTGIHEAVRARREQLGIE